MGRYTSWPGTYGDPRPYDGKHPDCVICQGRVQLQKRGSVTDPEMVRHYSLEPGTSDRVVHFFCHGITEPTRLVQFALWLGGNRPLINDTDYGDYVPYPELMKLPRVVTVHKRWGMSEWDALPRPIGSVLGSTGSPRVQRYPGRSIGESLGTGAYLVFGDTQMRRIATMTVPIAHMVQYRYFPH